MTKSKPIFKAAAWAARVLPDNIKRLFYKIPFAAKFIRRSLNNAVPQGLTDTVIAAGPAKGLRMSLDLQAEKDYWLGTYEPDLQTTAKKLVQPGMIVYDIGANIGYISLMCASLVGKSGKVFSFEPLPGNVERLTGNINLNQLGEQVIINHAAVVKESGDVTFLTHSSGAMGKALGSAGRDELYTSSITVPGISLDDYIYSRGNPPPDLIKLDIEGGEGNALLGAKEMLAEKHPLFLIELHGETAARQVWNILSANGYLIHTLEKGNPRVTDVDDLNWKAYIAAVHESQKTSLT